MMTQKGSWGEQNATFARHKTNQWSKYVIAIHYLLLCDYLDWLQLFLEWSTKGRRKDLVKLSYSIIVSTCLRDD